MAVRAITFDFWRTLFRDANSKERHRARVDALAETTGAPHAECKRAMKLVMEEFLRVHIFEQRTLTPDDAIPLFEEHLAITIAPDTGRALIDEFISIVLAHPPEPIEGALDAVRAAAERVPIGLISDTGISPGSAVSALLDRYGFLPYFKTLTFSDELGVAKPQAAMYDHAVSGLSVRREELFHIGDLEPTDVAGALNVGARAALFGGDNARYIAGSKAHHVYTSWREFVIDLPRILS